MRRDPRNINEYRKASSDTFASVVRSFGELNRSLQGIAEDDRNFQKVRWPSDRNSG
jgi:hypothetical protein